MKVAREVLAALRRRRARPRPNSRPPRTTSSAASRCCIDSNRKLLGNVANIAWNDLPLDYLDTWTRAVKRVTAADVKAAMARKLQPERMVTVVVGGKP